MKELTILIPMLTSLFLGKPIDVGQSDIVLIVSLVKKCFVRNRLKNPTVISIWLLVGFHPATRSVLSTPADNTRKRVWQYIEKERKKVSKGIKGNLIV